MVEYLHSFTKLEFDKVKNQILKYALSDLGKEQIEALLPSSSVQEVKYQLALVSEMKGLLTGDDNLPIGTIVDVRQSIQRSSIENYFLSSEELHVIVEILATARSLHTFFSRRKSAFPLLCLIVEEIYVDKVLEYNINQAIDEDGKIKDSASKELAGIRKQMVSKNISLRKNLERILKGVAGKDWSQDEIITTRDGRMVIPIKLEHKNRVPGFIHSSSSSGATVFIEPTETLDINNEIRELQFKEQLEIEKILRALTQQIRLVRDKLMFNVQILGRIDFIHAKAKYSIEILGSEPTISDTHTLLREAYHPILLSRHKRSEVQPLNIEIRDDVNTIVITGPNAGGKSVAMKTVGLLTLLLQSGCHIPASPDSSMRIFEKIFAEMGDNQSIENDLSSFSSHLRNLKLILEEAGPTSLVLIDEIGSGTDPAEGSAIASAILEQLSALGSMTIVTTHHGTLKTFAFEAPKFINAAMEFDQETLQPTYHFHSGIPGSSYAIEMAQRIGLPEKIINRSMEFRGSKANRLEDLITDLEKKAQELNHNLEKTENEKSKYTSLSELYENKVKYLEKELKEIKSQALNEAQAIVEKANTTIENTIKEIREAGAEKKTVKTAKENVKLISDEVLRFQTEYSNDEPINDDIKIGDIVKLKDSDSNGEVVAQVDHNHYIVLSGAVKLNVHRKNLQHSAKQVSMVKRTSPIEPAAKVHQEIDLRGLYGNEAIDAIEKFFDEAILSGLTRVNLIHGKGTGALRRKIKEYLENSSAVKSFRLGEWNEGVTVVELT